MRPRPYSRRGARPDLAAIDRDEQHISDERGAVQWTVQGSPPVRGHDEPPRRRQHAADPSDGRPRVHPASRGDASSSPKVAPHPARHTPHEGEAHVEASKAVDRSHRHGGAGGSPCCVRGRLERRRQRLGARQGRSDLPVLLHLQAVRLRRPPARLHRCRDDELEPDGVPPAGGLPDLDRRQEGLHPGSRPRHRYGHLVGGRQGLAVHGQGRSEVGGRQADHLRGLQVRRVPFVRDRRHHRWPDLPPVLPRHPHGCQDRAAGLRRSVQG